MKRPINSSMKKNLSILSTIAISFLLAAVGFKVYHLAKTKMSKEVKFVIQKSSEQGTEKEISNRLLELNSFFKKQNVNAKVSFQITGTIPQDTVDMNWDFVEESGEEALMQIALGKRVDVLLFAPFCHLETQILIDLRSPITDLRKLKKVIILVTDGYSLLEVNTVNSAHLNQIELFKVNNTKEAIEALANRKADAIITGVVIRNEKVVIDDISGQLQNESSFREIYRSNFKIPCVVEVAKHEISQDLKSKMISAMTLLLTKSNKTIKLNTNNNFENLSKNLDFVKIKEVNASLKQL
jgi:hypothetical protein